MDNELAHAHDVLLAYLVKLESGETPDYPYPSVIKLLSSRAYDDWVAGVYSFAALQPSEIKERLFGVRATHHAIAVYVASEFVDKATRERRDLLSQDEPRFRDLQETWSMPAALHDRTTALFEQQMQRLSSDKSVSPPRSAGDGKPLAVIVHGTAAANQKWWEPGSPFWLHIQQKWSHLYSGSAPFWWSGAVNHSARVAAANDLIRWSKLNGAGTIDVIAHSHGGNVCLEAAKLGLNINRLIMLGTPIRTEYTVHLGNIDLLSNVYSLGDKVQRKGAYPSTRFEGRTLGDSSRVNNWRAEDDGRGKSPGHSDLHEPPTWQASNLDALL